MTAPSKISPGLGTLLATIGGDDQALRLLVNTDGKPFHLWQKATAATRKSYEATLRAGFPADLEQAALKAPEWEGAMAYAEQQAAIAKGYRRRAVNVCRELLAGRQRKSTESEAEARTWCQAEEADRWAAIASSFREWLWEARGRDRAAAGPGGPGNGR